MAFRHRLGSPSSSPNAEEMTRSSTGRRRAGATQAALAPTFLAPSKTCSQITVMPREVSAAAGVVVHPSNDSTKLCQRTDVVGICRTARPSSASLRRAHGANSGPKLADMGVEIAPRADATVRQPYMSRNCRHSA